MYGLLLGGGYVAYRLYQNYAAGSAPAATIPTSTTLQTTALPTPTGSSGNAPVPSQQIPVSTASSSNLPSGITSTMYSVVQSWAQGDGRAPVLRMAAAMVPAEYAGMYDIITNAWDKNIKPNATQTAFWNALRKEYDPSGSIW